MATGCPGNKQLPSSGRAALQTAALQVNAFMFDQNLVLSVSTPIYKLQNQLWLDGYQITVACISTFLSFVLVD